MANFVVAVDADSERRSHFFKTIASELPPVAGLITNSCSCGDLSAIWASHPNFPVSVTSNESEAAIIWGEGIKQGESTRITASELLTLWQNYPTPFFDGYHAAITYHQDLGLIVSADILGYFPIYYYATNDIILIGSSPYLFKYHPSFQSKFNPSGLTGLLLINSSVDGQTIWQNVRRLSAGHFLKARNLIVEEVSQYQIPDINQDNPYLKLTYADHVDILEEIVEKTTKRHFPSEESYSILLSGGNDSRMLGGFLQEQGIKPIALHLGKRSDIEMYCATKVAQTLGLERHQLDVPFQHYPVAADLIVKWEQLATGLNGVVLGWGSESTLAKLAPKVIGGYSVGMVTGGPLHINPSGELWDFERYFTQSANLWGLKPEVLKRLLRKDIFEEAIEEVSDRIRFLYNTYSVNEERRTWWFELRQRQRFHVGSTAWRNSFGAYPILAILDWELLKTASMLPIESTFLRRAQQEILRNRFPKLAQLPLDRNGFNLEPLLSHKGDIALLMKLQRKWRQWQNQLGIERRFYYRILDINNLGWRKIRSSAEPYRSLAYEFFDREVLDELLPPPDVRIKCSQDTILETAGMRNLLSFLLWLGRFS